MIRMMGIFSSRLITFLTSLYIASILSEGDWGRISLIMNYFTIFLVFSGSFFPRSITTYTAQNNTNISNNNSALIISLSFRNLISVLYNGNLSLEYYIICTIYNIFTLYIIYFALKEENDGMVATPL